MLFVIFAITGVVLAGQTAMTMEYKEGEKIIKHPSGVISEYGKTDLERQRAELIEQRDRLNEQIAQLDKEVVDVALTVTVK